MDARETRAPTQPTHGPSWRNNVVVGAAWRGEACLALSPPATPPPGRRWPAPAAGAAVVLMLLATATPHAARAQSDTTPAPPLPSMASLATARVAYDAAHELMTVELPPANLPAASASMEGMEMSPVYQAIVPSSCTIYSARATVLDARGQVLPLTFLHHVHISDPDHRDLFQPIALHILALSKETPPLAVPQFLLGLPLSAGERLITWGMLHNTTSTAYSGVRIRVELGCRPTGQGLFGSVFPLFRAYPWVMDVLFPTGRRAYSLKSFDLPPGRTTKSTVGSPAIPGTIVGVGGHLHDYGVELELEDVTTGHILWRVTPKRDADGHVLDLPITTFYNWHRLGLHITPQHRYRITATYDNPTGRMIPDGGMGSIAGLFVPDRGTTWPRVDPTNPAYVQDMMETLGIGGTGKM